MKFVQNKFVSRDDKCKPESETALWKIPVTLITSKQPHKEINFLMEGREMKLFIPGIEANDWVKVSFGLFKHPKISN